MKRIFLLMLVAVCLTACTDDPCTEEEAVTAKPVIYLYPDEPVDEKPVVYLQPEVPMEVSVKLDYNGTLTSTYPAYGDGWTILAEPDGTLTDPETGREYYCLFWEGVTDVEYDFSTGFCVSGEDTAAFLEETLAALSEKFPEREAEIEDALYYLNKEVMRAKILNEGIRPDGCLMLQTRSGEHRIYEFKQVQFVLTSAL